jgi:hypothetical protein
MSPDQNRRRPAIFGKSELGPGVSEKVTEITSASGRVGMPSRVLFGFLRVCWLRSRHTLGRFPAQQMQRLASAQAMGVLFEAAMTTLTHTLDLHLGLGAIFRLLTLVHHATGGSGD